MHLKQSKRFETEFEKNDVQIQISNIYTLIFFKLINKASFSISFSIEN